MGLLHFQAANCKNCYRCIRTCPVKAIEFKDNQARIVAEECIFCCRCMKECPQNAKTVESDAGKVLRMLQSGAEVIVSLAPSFAGFTPDPHGYIRRLYRAGFSQVRETAEAAEEISRCYEEEFQRKGRLITTACPVVVEYIEKYSPQWVPYLAEADSPLMAHAKWIKERYPQAKVVFVGPCYAKKTEADQQPGYVDAVLTFEEVEWLPLLAVEEEGFAEGVPTTAAAETAAAAQAPLMEARLYPIDGGVVETTFKSGNGHPASTRLRAVSGIENCRKLLSSLKELPEGYFLEMNACEGGCINGPAAGSHIHPLLKQDRILAYRQNPAPQGPALPMANKEMVRRTFRDRSKAPVRYSKEAIRDILRKLGKERREDELNCGACGYDTCKDKAEAVLAGKAELYMCMPYAQTKAESFAHVLLEKTPNAVIAVTDQHLIKEVNAAVGIFFQTDPQELLGLPLEYLIPAEEITLSPHEQSRKKLYFPELRKIAIVSAAFVPEQQLYLVILHDLTEQEQEQEKLRVLKQETVEMAQRVIENQMRVAQEIAGLLGETTAETKVTLTKMKRLLLED
ncbi:[Fe-Fe] hydrogenase large subunit C-terminal domain-containing protein [Paenibacillus mesotrionivorans]|uniref:[Fe-Fe] hydrogenase large subunit C-terminal domain-containing protein n=1 Tax=Paenibacillus mesotrionivorans TaxID=3160968 RepID=A0ACC7P5D5_9BACL